MLVARRNYVGIPRYMHVKLRREPKKRCVIIACCGMHRVSVGIVGQQNYKTAQKV